MHRSVLENCGIDPEVYGLLDLPKDTVPGTPIQQVVGLDDYISVSYTHLDVYKRQLLRAVMEGRLPNEKAALLAALEKEGLL